jgi:hypothetical protein
MIGPQKRDKMPREHTPEIFELRMSHAHSLFIPHKPKEVLCTDGLCENILSELTEEAIADFGLFGGNADPNKFYDIQPEAWTPQEADFIQPVFRGLSKGRVVHGWRVFNFGEGDVLKKSMPLLKGVTINTNHETEVENAIGAVASVAWQEETKVGNIVIPSGVNFVAKIDAKSNPRIARGILMDPPSIHSNSVSIKFKWKKSHEDVEDFWDKIGSFDADGKLYELIVTEIISFGETSLVNHGADPFAQIIVDNKIINPKYASKVYPFSYNNELNLNNHKNNNNMEFADFLKELGLKEDQFADVADFKAHFETLQNNQVPQDVNLEELQQASSELAALREVSEDITPESLTTLTENQVTEEQQTALAALEEHGGVEAIADMQEEYNTSLGNLRLEAINAYKILKGDQASADIIKLMEEATYDQVIALRDEHVGDLEKTVPLTCNKCGSEDVTRRVSGTFEAPKNDTLELREKIRRKHRKSVKSLHSAE